LIFKHHDHQKINEKFIGEKMKKLKDLAPHEKEILNSELLKEQQIQERLREAIRWNIHQKTLKNLGGFEGLGKISKQLEEHGLTPEKAEQMSTEEFENFIAEHDIKV